MRRSGRRFSVFSLWHNPPKASGEAPGASHYQTDSDDLKANLTDRDDPPTHNESRSCSRDNRGRRGRG